MPDDVVIKVDQVSKTFKLPHEKQTSLKSALINLLKGGKGTYERQEVLRDVSFEIQKGDFFGIVGRNGSGKSTLLKLLAGIYAPNKGSITVNGKLTPFIELGVGFNPELTGRENVFLNGALLGFNRKEMEAKYNDIVSFAEIEKFMDQKLKNYSSGMQVRLAFSIAIRAESDILLLDEVLAVGDAAFQQKCYNYFEDLKQQQRTVVFVSHSMDAVRRFCTKAIYINKGELTHQGNPSDIADIYLEENMEKTVSDSADQEGPAFSKEHKLMARVTNQANGIVALQFSYASEQKDDLYMAISIIKDGISIAEINTIEASALKSSGRATYYLDTGSLNGGIYHIGGGLFRKHNRELVAVSKKREFIVKGNDITRGAALKLADTWKYE